MTNSLINIIKKIEPLQRYNVSPDLDYSLKIIKSYYPELRIIKFKSGKKVWDWIIPKKWKVEKAYISFKNKKILDIKDHPLRIWSGSWSSNKKKIFFNELKKNIHAKRKLKNLIPWKYKYYFHNKNFWGFSVTFNEYLKLKRLNGPFKAVIKTKFYNDFLQMGEIVLKGDSNKKILISSDICHPGQVNDSLSGVYCALKLYNFLKKRKNKFTYVFTFQPEMIGTIAYLSKQKSLKNFIFGIFSEMMGDTGHFTLQKSFEDKSFIDNIAISTIKKKYKKNSFKIKKFLEKGIVNDELILNHAGIPSIALNRGPFKNYHTSGDSYQNIKLHLLNDSFDTFKKIIINLEKNFKFQNDQSKNQEIIDKKRICYTKKFKGPIFLDRHGLYVDWQKDWRMNTIIDMIMIMLNGKYTIDEIASRCRCEKKIVKNFVNQLLDRKIVYKVK